MMNDEGSDAQKRRSNYGDGNSASCRDPNRQRQVVHMRLIGTKRRGEAHFWAGCARKHDRHLAWLIFVLQVNVGNHARVEKLEWFLPGGDLEITGNLPAWRGALLLRNEVRDFATIARLAPRAAAVHRHRRAAIRELSV
jgi:hypothetical protein